MLTRDEPAAPAPPVTRARSSATLARTRLDRLGPLGLAALTLFLRLATAAHYPTEWDGVQLVFGVDRFDVREGSPHAPGYWLYVAAGRLVRLLTPLDATQSLTLLAALASAATVAIAYVLGRELGGRWLGFAAAAYLAVAPFTWFYGSTVNTYTFDALTSVVLLLLAWRARPGSWHGVAAAIVLGLATGFRQTTLLVLAPVALVAVWRSVRTARRAALAVVAGAAAIAVWLVPMTLEQPGGFSALRAMDRRTWDDAANQASVFYGATAQQARSNFADATGYALASLALVLLVTMVALGLRLAARSGREPAPRPGWRALTAPRLLWLALVPPFAFTVLVFFGKAGYVLSYLPAAVLLALWPASRLTGRPRTVVTALVAVVCVVSAQRFASGTGVLPDRLVDGPAWFTKPVHGAPYRLTHREIERVDSDTDRYLQLARRFDPRRDVLVYVWLDGSWRYRHAMLTLPAFTAHHVIDGQDKDTGRRRRWLHEYDTRIEIPPGGESVWVLDAPTPEVQQLVDAGRVHPVRLRAGPTVYVAGPGVTMFGVTVREVPGATTGPLRRLP